LDAGPKFPASNPKERSMQTRVFVTLLIGIVLGAVILTATISGMARIVMTDSMAPSIRAGDVVLIKPLTSEIAPGMIITYNHGNKAITHRVVMVDGDNMYTKGDNSEQIDPWKVPISSVIGVTFFTIPYLGYLLSFVRQPLGLLLVILVPSLFIIAFELKGILKTMRAHTNTRI
jgi:signal peptidase I